MKVRLALCGHEYLGGERGCVRRLCPECEAESRLARPQPKAPRGCEVAGCTRRHNSHGLCLVHARQVSTHGAVAPTEPRAPERHCPTCGTTIRRDAKFCSRRCSADAQRGPESCSIDGCDKPHRARGLCATHYNRTHQPDRHKPVEVACVVCGAVVVRHKSTSRVYGQVCSDMCRGTLTRGRPNVYTSTKLPKYHMARWVGQSMAVAYSDCGLCGQPIARDARNPHPPARCPECREKRPRFVAGYCVACSTPFIADRMAFHGRARFCSPACGEGRRRAADKRPGWKRIAAIQGHLRCHICGDHCDPTDFSRTPSGAFVAGITYPSVDHIHPLARGGSNDLDNLALAHMLCNSWKSDSVAA